MGEAGLFSGGRVELLEGEVIEMSPIGSRHAGCVTALDGIFRDRLKRSVIVWVQNPVVLSRRSEPQPDLALLRPREDGYRTRLPEPSDVLLIVEVMDATQAYDRGPKLRTYAAAGIPEVWLVDLEEESVETCREPGVAKYREVVLYRRGQRVSPAAFPGKTFRVAEILG
jgi:Uma2 family endonuclease